MSLRILSLILAFALTFGLIHSASASGRDMNKAVRSADCMGHGPPKHHGASMTECQFVCGVPLPALPAIAGRPSGLTPAPVVQIIASLSGVMPEVATPPPRFG